MQNCLWLCVPKRPELPGVDRPTDRPMTRHGNWSSEPNNKGMVVCIAVYGCVHLKDPVESVKKRRGLSLGSGFLSVIDIFITLTKGKR